MGVVAAGVLHSFIERFVRFVAGFLNGEGINVGAPGNHGAGLAAFQNADDAVAGDAGADFEAEGLEAFGDNGGSALFAIGEFGMGVKIAPVGKDTGAEGFRDGRNALRAGLAEGVEGGENEKEYSHKD